MKSLVCTKTLIALVVAIAAAAGSIREAQGQPVPPPPNDSGMPTGIAPGTPLADVVKMLQAAVDQNTIRSYVLNSQSPFNLDADKIIYLKDEGAPSDLINTMMDRDKALAAASVAPAPQPVSPPVPVASGPDTAPPTAEVSANSFYDTLSPYGGWVDVEGYGRCWRPTVVVYNSGWSPYCDSGHWVYTDYGWYWDSDYSWGITFHYGRWFRSPRFGWVWYPDTVWAPSWVAWRSGGDYCGWAPLPPFAIYRPGVGFFYRGVSVGVDFDFGLAADCFVFVDAGHFCDRRPRSFCVPHDRVTQVFHQTTIINNYKVVNNRVVNRGFGTERVASAMHRDIQPIHVSALPNAAREGWHGDAGERPVRTGAVNYNSTAGHETTIRTEHSSPAYGSTGGNEQLRNNSLHEPVLGAGTQNNKQTEQFRSQSQNSQYTGGNHVQSQTFPEAGHTITQNPAVGAGAQNNKQTEQFRSPPQNPQYTGGNHVGSQTYPEAGHPITQNPSQGSQWQQNRNTGSAANNEFQQHGGAQLQQGSSHQSSQGQNQQRNSGNAGNGQNKDSNNGQNR